MIQKIFGHMMFALLVLTASIASAEETIEYVPVLSATAWEKTAPNRWEKVIEIEETLAKAFYAVVVGTTGELFYSVKSECPRSDISGDEIQILPETYEFIEWTFGTATYRSISCVGKISYTTHADHLRHAEWIADPLPQEAVELSAKRKRDEPEADIDGSNVFL